MDLSKVKMVVTDMDGTLLNSKGQISSTFFNLYSELKKFDIEFVAASGRPFDSITNKIGSLKDEITIVSENGAYAKHGGKELLITNLNPGRSDQILPILRGLEGVYPVLCGKNFAYLETNEKRFIEVFNEYYVSYKIVDDLTKVNNDNFLKIAVYHFDSSEKFIYPAVKHLENEMQVKVSGEHWVDLSETNANKGYAIDFLQNKWRITKEETMVFGDFNNDLEMLALAEFSFAMENAHPNVLKAANYMTKSNDDHGVEFVLEQLLEAKKKSELI